MPANPRLVPVYQYTYTATVNGPPYWFSTATSNAYSWVRGHIAFYAWDSAFPGSVPVYQYSRASSPGSPPYWFSTATHNDYGWARGHIAFYALPDQAPGSVPVYQYSYQSNPGGHPYWFSRDASNDHDWIRGHIAFYAYAEESSNIVVGSAGKDDGNYSTFDVLGPQDNAFCRRGINVMTVDLDTLAVLDSKSFDTYWSDYIGARELVSFIHAQPRGRVVLASVADSAEYQLTAQAITALESLGATQISGLKHRDSWAFIGVKGGSAAFEVLSRRYHGPAQLVVSPADLRHAFTPLPEELSPATILSSETALAWMAEDGALGATSLIRSALEAVLEGPGDFAADGGGAGIDALDRTRSVTIAGMPAEVRLVILHKRSGSWSSDEGPLRAVLRIYITKRVAPSDLLGGLMWDGVLRRDALDFASLDHPVLYLSTYDTTATELPFLDPSVEESLTAAGIDTQGRYLDGRELVYGLSLFAGGPRASDMDRFPKTLTRPLYWLMTDLNADPSLLEVSVDRERATALFAPTEEHTLIDEPELQIRLSNREIGVELGYQSGAAKGSPSARRAPKTTAGDGSSESAMSQALTMRSDVDVTLASGLGTALPFPKADTARMTLGLSVSRDEQSTSAIGWLQLREDQTPWSRPFGLPGLAIHAFYGELDLVKRKLRALHGHAQFCGKQAEVAMRVSAESRENMVALRVTESVSLLNIVFEVFAQWGQGGLADTLDQLRLEPMPARDAAPGEEVDPDEYNVYGVLAEQTLNDRTYPPGFALRGTLRAWDAVALEVDLSAEWGESLTLRGDVTKVSFGDGFFSLDLGGASGLQDVSPLDISVDRHFIGSARLGYDLSLLGLPSIEGHLEFTASGADFVLPQPTRGGLFGGSPQTKITSISTAGAGFDALKISGEIAVTYDVPLPTQLHTSLAELPGGHEISVSGTVLFTDAVLSADKLTAYIRVRGRIELLDKEEIIDIGELTFKREDLEDLPASVAHWLDSWVTKVLSELLSDIPILGAMLMAVYGLGVDAIGRLYTALDGLGVPIDGGMKAAMGAAGFTAQEIDNALSKAMDWARKSGIAVGADAARIAVDGLANGLESGLSFVGERLDEIPGFSAAIGSWSGGLGRLLGGAGSNDPSKEALQTASETAAAAQVAIFYQQRELGGDSFPLPLGSYPKMPPALQPGSSDGAGANSLVLPRGWTVQVWDGENFTGQSAWFDVTTNSLGDWIDRIRSVRVMHHGRVIYYKDSYYRDSIAKGGAGWLNDAWLQEVSSIILAPGWTIVASHKNGTSKTTITGSTHYLNITQGRGWNDGIRSATITYTPPPPVQWL